MHFLCYKCDFMRRFPPFACFVGNVDLRPNLWLKWFSSDHISMYFGEKMVVFSDENTIKIRFPPVFPQKWVRMVKKSKKSKKFQICHKFFFCPDRWFFDGKSHKKQKFGKKFWDFFFWYPEAVVAQKSIQMDFWVVHRMCAGKVLSNPKMSENFIHLWWHWNFLRAEQKIEFFEKNRFSDHLYWPPYSTGWSEILAHGVFGQTQLSCNVSANSEITCKFWLISCGMGVMKWRNNCTTPILRNNRGFPG